MRQIRIGHWVRAASIGGIAYLSAAGCSQCHRRTPAPVGQPLRTASPSTPAFSAAHLVSFAGMCDASAAVPIDAKRFLVANDEDNVLRIYDATLGGDAIEELDLSTELDTAPTIHRRKKRVKEMPARPPKEADIEAATRLGERACFLASHSKAGGPRAPRVRFVLFCTNLPQGDEPMGIVGSPYRSLYEDLSSSPLLAQVNWDEAVRTRPPDETAMNIEAMTAAPGGGLWVGFRSPLHEDKAIFVLVGNAQELPFGGRARIERIEFLELGGLGARGLTFDQGEYLIAAGPASKGKSEGLFRWIPGSAPAALSIEWPSDFNLEGFFNDPGSPNQMLLLSDDGDLLVDGVPCKKLEDPSTRRFRGLWLDRRASG